MEDNRTNWVVSNKYISKRSDVFIPLDTILDKVGYNEVCDVISQQDKYPNPHIVIDEAGQIIEGSVINVNNKIYIQISG